MWCVLGNSNVLWFANYASSLKGKYPSIEEHRVPADSAVDIGSLKRFAPTESRTGRRYLDKILASGVLHRAADRTLEFEAFLIQP